MARKDDRDNPLLRGVPDASRGRLKHVLNPGASGQVRAALRLPPRVLQEQTRELATIAAELPVGALSGAQKAALRKQGRALAPGIQRATALALRELPVLRQVVAISPEQLETLAEQQRRYLALRDQAARGLELVGKLRRIIATFTAYIIDAGTRFVVESIEDPSAAPAYRELLRQKGALLLRTRDDIITAQVEGRAAARDRREADSAEADRLRKEALIQDVKAAVKHGWPLDRDSLNRAARYYAELYGDARPDEGREPRARSPK